ncbi:MAG: hypothetical protein E7191_05505 [Erysipelotrichaceae bacterium]|nr:hypothetical protein [Erysipelotrichaceae bacterium]
MKKSTQIVDRAICIFKGKSCAQMNHTLANKGCGSMYYGMRNILLNVADQVKKDCYINGGFVGSLFFLCGGAYHYHKTEQLKDENYKLSQENKNLEMKNQLLNEQLKEQLQVSKAIEEIKDDTSKKYLVRFIDSNTMEEIQGVSFSDCNLADQYTEDYLLHNRHTIDKMEVVESSC